MPPRSQETLAGPLPLIALAAFLAVGGALLIAKASPTIGLGAGILLIVLFASFLNTELALHIILLSMLLSPEIVVGAVGGISIGKPNSKADVLVLRIEDLILTVVTFAWLARTAIFKELGLIRRTPLNAPMLAYIVSMVLATLLGVFFGTVKPLRGFFFTLKYFEYFVVFFMTVNYVHEERQLKRLLATAFVTCAVSSLMGIVQIPSGERVGAPFEGQHGEPNTFGGYLVLMLALILAQLLASTSFMSGLGWLAFAGLVTLPLLYTLSRSSWLACIPMLLTLVVLSRRRLLLVSALGVLIVLAPFTLPKQVVERYNYTLNEKFDRGDYRIAGSRLDTSTSARLDSWKVALHAWAGRPFFGYGVTGFGFIDAQYFRILIEGGLLGLSAFFWLLWGLVRIGLHAMAELEGSRFKALAVGYLAGVAALAIHAVGANTFIIVRIMEPFWFLAGIVTLFSTLTTKSTPAAEVKAGGMAG